MIDFAFKHPRLKLLFQYPNTYTSRSSNGGCQTSTSLRQSLHLCRATARVTGCLLAYYRRFRTYTRLLQSFPNTYQTPTVTAKLEQGLLNVYQPSTVSVELKWGLPNVYQPSTVSAELEQVLPNMCQSQTVSAELKWCQGTSTSLRQSMDWLVIVTSIYCVCVIVLIYRSDF